MLTPRRATVVLVSDLDQLKLQHTRALQSGLPVLAWPTFESAYRDLCAATSEFQAAILTVDEFIDSVVPPDRRIGPLWFTCAGPAVESARELLLSDSLPNLPTALDCGFALTYGKSPRNPLSRMNRKTSELRRHTSRIRTRLAAIQADL